VKFSAVTISLGNDCVQAYDFCLKLLDVGVKAVNLQNLGVYVPLLRIDMGLLLIKYNTHVTYLLVDVAILGLNCVVELRDNSVLLGSSIFRDSELLLQFLDLPLEISVDINLSLA